MKNRLLVIITITTLFTSCGGGESMNDFIFNIMNRMPEMSYQEFHSYYVTRAELELMAYDKDSPLGSDFMEQKFPYLDDEGLAYRSNIEFRGLIECDSKYIDSKTPFRYPWKQLRGKEYHNDRAEKGYYKYFFSFTDEEKVFKGYVEYIRYKGKIYMLNFHTPRCSYGCDEPVYIEPTF